MKTVGTSTVPIKSIRHPVWPVTCLTKLWFRQVGYWAVTTQKNSSELRKFELLAPKILYVDMYLKELFSWPKIVPGVIFVIWGLLEVILVDLKIDSSVASGTCDLCDLSSKLVGLWPVTAELI